MQCYRIKVRSSFQERGSDRSHLGTQQTKNIKNTDCIEGNKVVNTPKYNFFLMISNFAEAIKPSCKLQLSYPKYYPW